EKAASQKASPLLSSHLTPSKPKKRRPARRGLPSSASTVASAAGDLPWPKMALPVVHKQASWDLFIGNMDSYFVKNV
ncbi:unnamed protein product, partial [Urochloa humidicola]